MKWIAYSGLFLYVGILTLVACAPPGVAPTQSTDNNGQTIVVPPTPEPPPEYLILGLENESTVSYSVISASTPYQEGERRSGCTPLLPFDSEEASDIYPEEHWVLWTFTVNFELLSKDRNPLGCLRLYQRNEETFDLIENGNILVDTCKVTRNTDNNPGVTFNSGSAIFDGTGYIACGINLSNWIENISTNINLTLTGPGEGAASVTESFTSTHTYENFTIAAAIVPTLDAVDMLLPLVYYDPIASNTARPALELKSKAFDQLSGAECDKTIQDSNEQLWWYDLRSAITAEQESYFRYALNFLNSPVDYSKYNEDCSMANIDPLEFSLQDATLYIGYNPVKKKIYMGTIEGILIDPTDSKPEKQ